FYYLFFFFFFKQKTAYEIGLGIPAEPLFRSTLFPYTQDAFSRSGWLWPVDAKGEPLKATSYMAVGFYVAKYVNKKSDMDLAAKEIGRASCRERVKIEEVGVEMKKKKKKNTSETKALS